jgi:hypothetical protein
MSLAWIILLLATGLALVLYAASGRVRRWLVISGFCLILGVSVVWGIIELGKDWPSSRVPSVFFWLTLVIIAALGVAIWLGLRSGRNYSVHDTEAQSSDYANDIKEGHGGLTAFLWVSFGAILVWTIVYLIQHGSEFGVLFGG